MSDGLSDRDLQRKVVRASIATRVFILFVGISLSIILMFTTYTVHQIRSQQVQSRGTLLSATAAAEAARETAESIHSCVTPGESCYERSQRQQAGAVADINRVVILAAACAVDLPDNLPILQRQTQIQACVINGLARENARAR
jgi:hypothetical protein